jgi:two-component system, cell cycle sensor histidine kinase and response regulator CckA
LIGEHIRLQWRCDAVLPLVFVDPSMIEQLILNLAVNARDAMPNGGNLTLSVEAVTLEEPDLNRHPKARAGRFVCLSVSDTGCGIEDKNLTRIFDPFFTTKEVGKGTGLGLATTYGIVEQHQGWIEVTSQLDQGTTFKVYLPASDAESSDSFELETPAIRQGQGEMVLLVEDELAVQEFAERVLRRGGYQVLVAPTAVQALELWPRHHNQIELLVTDQVMPEGMTGHELAMQLRADKPSLKVILMSGYCAKAEDLIKSDETVGEFIAKPFTPAQLLGSVQRALSG